MTNLIFPGRDLRVAERGDDPGGDGPGPDGRVREHPPALGGQDGEDKDCFCAAESWGFCQHEGNKTV